MNRHLSRMVAMQTLYEWDFRDGCDLNSIKQRNITEYEKDVDSNFVDFLVDGVSGKLGELDEKIVVAAPEWPLEQISLIDKTILRIAIYELLYSTNVPPKVAINEAVELSKQFGGENSSKFINGVLGTVFDSNHLENKETEKLEEDKERKVDEQS